MTVKSRFVILLFNRRSCLTGIFTTGRCEGNPAHGWLLEWIDRKARLRANRRGGDDAIGPPGGDPGGIAFFEAKIRPVLVEKCQECHSAEAKKPKGGLKVDSRAAIRAGRDVGAGRRAGRPGRQPALPGDLGRRRSRADAAQGQAPRVGRRRLPPVDHRWAHPTHAMGTPTDVGLHLRRRP